MAVSVVSQTYPTTRGTGQKEYTGLESAYQVVKASSGTVNYVKVDNTLNTSQAVYVKFYDDATPVVGTDDQYLMLRAGAGATVSFVPMEGIAFATAISVLCVTAGGTDGTVSPANSVVVTVVYT